MAILGVPYRDNSRSQPSKWGDPTADHQMWQDVKGLDATGGVRPKNPVLDLEVRGAGLSERERPGGVEALCFYPCGPLLMTLQSAHGQRFRAFHAARPVHNFLPLALPTASG
jgi:hypothetical protein